MKKVFLVILVALAITSFFFFTPVLFLMLGLCCLGVGTVSVIHPERMSFDWFRHPSWIRATGSILFLFGSLASMAGGALTDQLYFKHQPTTTAEANAGWTTVGSAPSRPMTHPASTTGGTDETGASTNDQQHSLMQTIKEWIKPSAPSQNNQDKPADTDTSSQPDQNGTSSSTPSTQPSTQPSKKKGTPPKTKPTTHPRPFPTLPGTMPNNPLDFHGKKWDHPDNGH